MGSKTDDMRRIGPLHVNEYGGAGPAMIVLHGGPAAYGSMAPVARGLADGFQVIEPYQRGSGDEPLTVARHVADLYELIQALELDEPPAVVGESWGAMLALAFAAAHPEAVSRLGLIGCGTFDTVARGRLEAILAERMGDEGRRALERLAEVSDPGERLTQHYELIMPLYDYDPVEEDTPDLTEFDMQAHRETWEDMLRCQAEGLYPATFAAIAVPVLMLHGDYDPHPGEMIRDGLARLMPQLQYHPLARCGHSPWKERFAREEFFAALRGFLSAPG